MALTNATSSFVGLIVRLVESQPRSIFLTELIFVSSLPAVQEFVKIFINLT
jgi:hypothetical protein